jgi:predicted secreted protein
MEFDRLLKFSEYSRQQEIVGLAVFYLEEYCGSEEVEREEIIKLIEKSRESVPKGNVSTYFSRLEEDNYLTTGTEGYRLKHEGKEFFKRIISSDLVEEPRQDQFIDTDIADEEFYEQLIEEINECYRVRVNNAVLVLTRKLFENILADILRGHYGRQNVDLSFDTHRGYHHGLKQLKNNFRDNVSDFRIYSRDIDEDILDGLDEFKKRGDAGAHSIAVNVTDGEIEAMSDDATQLFNILYDTWKGVRIANDNSD